MLVAAAVHYLAVAAEPCATVMRPLTYAHPGGEGNKDRPIRFQREPNYIVTQLVQYFSVIGDT